MIMKRSLGLKKVSIRLQGNSGPIYHTLADNVLNSKKIIIAPGVTAYSLPNGTILETYLSGGEYPPYLFEGSDVVISYQVPDLDQAIIELRQRGALIILPDEQPHQQLRYCHVRTDGQSLFGLYQED